MTRGIGGVARAAKVCSLPMRNGNPEGEDAPDWDNLRL